MSKIKTFIQINYEYELTVGWRMLHIEELHNFFPLPSIIRVAYLVLEGFSAGQKWLECDLSHLPSSNAEV
jgi:hypothetical protein